MSNEPLLPSLRRAKPVVHIAMSPDGSRVAVARTNKVVELWDGHGTLLGWHKVHQQPIAQLAISDDGSQIVSMSEVPRRFFDEALIWDFPNARVKRMDPAGRFPGYQSPQFVPGTREFVVKKRWLYCYDGLEAVEAAAMFKPDVILLDIGLPHLNGYETCRRIREQSWGEKIVIIALTGWGQEEDREKSRHAGFNGHMVKPVELTTLTKLLAELLPTPE